jgi:dynein heavy chain
MEIAFWRARCEDLSGISAQLESPQLKRIVEVLKAKNSSHLKMFMQHAERIQLGSREAQDNLRFLEQVRKTNALVCFFVLMPFVRV